MRVTPTSTRKLSASTLTVGWASTNSPIGRAATIITPTEANTAATITGRLLVMPTAVMTESSEKTMSMTAICTSTLANAAFVPAAPPAAGSPGPSSDSWISFTLFHNRNRPPPMRMTSRPEMAWSNTVTRGAVRPMIHTRENRSAMRVPIARSSPKRRARLRCSSGRRPASTEMNTMLSMPRTISSAVKVRNAIQIWGSSNHSMIHPIHRDAIQIMPSAAERATT